MDVGTLPPCLLFRLLKGLEGAEATQTSEGKTIHPIAILGNGIGAPAELLDGIGLEGFLVCVVEFILREAIASLKVTLEKFLTVAKPDEIICLVHGRCPFCIQIVYNIIVVDLYTIVKSLRKMSELVLIIGPCGAGKTTYARTHYPTHLHPDMEAIMHTLYVNPIDFRYHAYIRTCGKILTEQATQHLLAKQQSVCLTIGGATRKDRQKWIAIATECGAFVRCVRLLVDPETAIIRARSDPSRPATSKSKWRKIVEHWFRDFEPVDAEAEEIAFYQEIDNNG